MNAHLFYEFGSNPNSYTITIRLNLQTWIDLFESFEPISFRLGLIPINSTGGRIYNLFLDYRQTYTVEVINNQYIQIKVNLLKSLNVASLYNTIVSSIQIVFKSNSVGTEITQQQFNSAYFKQEIINPPSNYHRFSSAIRNMNNLRYYLSNITYSYYNNNNNDTTLGILNNGVSIIFPQM